MENTVGNAITIAISGFSVVFLCLTFFALMIASLNFIDKKINEYKKKKTTNINLSNTLNHVINDGVEEEVIPVIIAAVYSVYSKQVIIRQISFTNKTSNDSDWSRISRASSLATHNIRRRI